MKERLKPAAIAALKHLAVSSLVAILCATLVFGLWYPPPYGKIAGGFSLFGIMMAVHIICGPLLTLVVFNPSKPRSELVRDISLIVLVQLVALSYGIYSAAKARPVYLSYEGNRFRVVSMADIDTSKLAEALPEFRSPSYTGPRLIGAKLTESTDPHFKESIELSMQGLHPSFRPARWVKYETLIPHLQKSLQSISALKAKHPNEIAQIDSILATNSLTEENAGYLPLDAEKANPANWVVIVEKNSGQPKAFLPLDGW